MMHFLPQDFHSKRSKLQSIANYSNLELGEVISAVWIKLHDHAQSKTETEPTADDIIKSVGSEIRRKNHYDVSVARDPAADDEEGAEHLSLFDLSQKDKISDLTPLDLLLKYEQKQQVDKFINDNFGGSGDAALAHFGDTKALSELLHVSRRRAQQIVKKRKEENSDQIDLFGGDGNPGGDE
jgi:hypothetical protein